ncbi:MAG: aminotransferase class V-fold PLP-dependent enzyme [Actinobacteria bacterium]|nr:MAG: aminotransferase class V-fold PLP-dependent enzyme [Actinomycetota bacterium]
MGRSSPQEDRLALDRESMRALGHRVVDLLVDRLTVDGLPLRRATPAEMRERLAGPPPAGPQPPEKVLERLERDVLPFRSRVDHPRFLAFVPGSGTWPGALADLVASACNVYAGSWMESAGPSQVELEVLGWFKDWLGYPPTAAGSLTTGGSAANMTAFACARENLAGAMRDDLVVYVSDQAHSSVARSARVLGFRPDQVRVLPTREDLRLEPGTLERAIEADLRAGRSPLLVSANAGATNAGTVDPLAELADVCRRHGIWLHADAAYGGFAVLCERGRRELQGLEHAESVTLDPHKWLYQPFECGCLLVRDGKLLRSAFEIAPDYLSEARAAEGETNFADLGLQLTRTSRALKVWLSIQILGLDAFREAIERSLKLAEHAARRVEESKNLELLVPRSLGIVCLRRRFEGADEAELEPRNASLAAALERSGTGLVSSTRLHGRYALRLCILNHTTGLEDVDAVLDFLEHEEPSGEPARSHERHPDVTESLVPPPLGRQPLFASLAADEAEQVAALASGREAQPGETVVEQWGSERDFFVIEDGTADVFVGEEHVATLGPGDFFGELAALDWGAGYGYPRLATVVAGSPLRLLVFADGALAELMRFPSVERRIRAAVHERLPRT